MWGSTVTIAASAIYGDYGGDLSDTGVRKITYHIVSDIWWSIKWLYVFPGALS